MSAVLRSPASFAIRPFDAPFGAEVIGLDLSRPLGQDDFARIHRAHLDYHVLVFRDQRITRPSRSCSAAGRLRAELNSHQFDLHSAGGAEFQAASQRIHGLLFGAASEPLRAHGAQHALAVGP